MINRGDLEGGGGGEQRLGKEMSGQQEVWAWFNLKSSNYKPDARGVFGLVSLFSLGKVSSRKPGWRWFRVRRCSRTAQGEQGSQGRGCGSCNHVDHVEREEILLKTLAELQVMGQVGKPGSLDG